ncbi:Fe-S protein [Archaeoglobales archaeon]|nr:MAG: Fe-S protein [Archaeoglobales archaeon]
MAEIKEILPCIADPNKIRVIGKIDVKDDFKEMMPYVAWLIPNSSYNKKMGWITYKKGVRIITIHSDGFVAMTQTKDEDEAMQTLKEIEKIVERAYKEKDKIDVSKPKEKITVSVMDVYNYLPKTNCKECGEQTCMAFAVKLLNGELNVKLCKPLFKERKYVGIREALISLLTSAGFEVEL